jgi:hypothetical protein
MEVAEVDGMNVKGWRVQSGIIVGELKWRQDAGSQVWGAFDSGNLVVGVAGEVKLMVD